LRVSLCEEMINVALSSILHTITAKSMDDYVANVA
jgi:Tfp pilus assembly protein PilE